MDQSRLPRIENFLTSDGKGELRTLFAVAVLRSLSSRELREVTNAMALIEPFLICQGERFKYQALHFDIDRIAEDFDDANSEYGPEDEGPSAAWSSEACRELESALTATMAAWLDKHGYSDAWAIDARGYEQITAQAIEARRAATGTGAVHESRHE